MSVNNKEYALLGGGGLAIEIAEYMLTEGYSLHGYYAPCEDADSSVILPYLGDERCKFSRNLCYIIGAGLIQLRSKMISFIEANDLEAGTFISRHAYLSSLAKIGKGSVICPQAVVSGNPSIGSYVPYKKKIRSAGCPHKQRRHSFHEPLASYTLGCCQASFFHQHNGYIPLLPRGG